MKAVFYHIGRLLSSSVCSNCSSTSSRAGPLGPSPKMFTFGIVDFSRRLGADALDTLASRCYISSLHVL